MSNDTITFRMFITFPICMPVALLGNLLVKTGRGLCWLANRIAGIN